MKFGNKNYFSKRRNESMRPPVFVKNLAAFEQRMIQKWKNDQLIASQKIFLFGAIFKNLTSNLYQILYMRKIFNTINCIGC